jgi:hypothetical protein
MAVEIVAHRDKERAEKLKGTPQLYLWRELAR